MTEPTFARRVPGSTGTGAPSVTTIVVPAARTKVIIALDGHAEFTINLIETDLAQLLTALREGEISYVSSTHTVYGRVLLNARPADVSPRTSASGRTQPGPRELSLTLPEQGTVQVMFDTEQTSELVRQLDAARTLLARVQPHD
ncbi:hypothetical protein [Kutzneria kofuensis]|uniref:Uncharacterized protein n=1 Tax=Kutzneria kofuensis TaxID=103725 RepID=A0A7W9KDI5_9PSEU|nr:hypothetical protein [Kutzneria kofuensis]MBB5890609.1 hypothetical protein [Kutzneria kofuensis]